MAERRKRTPVRKLSATILDFAKPLLTPDATPAQRRDVLKLAIMVWNALVLRANGDSFALDEMLRLSRLRGSPPEAALLLDLLCRRHADAFADDRRLVGEWSVGCVDARHCAFTAETRTLPRASKPAPSGRRRTK